MDRWTVAVIETHASLWRNILQWKRRRRKKEETSIWGRKKAKSEREKNQFKDEVEHMFRGLCVVETTTTVWLFRTAIKTSVFIGRKTCSMNHFIQFFKQSVCCIIQQSLKRPTNFVTPKTDNPTFTPTFCSGGPGVRRWERRRSLNFSLKVSFLILHEATSVTFRLHRQVHQGPDEGEKHALKIKRGELEKGCAERFNCDGLALKPTLVCRLLCVRSQNKKLLQLSATPWMPSKTDYMKVFCISLW